MMILSKILDSNVYMWHREHGNLIAVLQGHYGMVNCVNWNPRDPYMFVSASDDHSVRVWGRPRHSKSHIPVEMDNLLSS